MYRRRGQSPGEVKFMFKCRHCSRWKAVTAIFLTLTNALEKTF